MSDPIPTAHPTRAVPSEGAVDPDKPGSATTGDPLRAPSSSTDNGNSRSRHPRLPGAFDLNRLAVLREVAQRGSFAAAAEALCFTPSAVSQQMATLERGFGLTLFERTSRGMRLTDAGDALLAHADAVLTRLADAEVELDAIGRGDSGQLRIGSFTSATSTFVALAMETFRKQHPGVEITFFDGEPYENIVRLRARELDLALIFDFDHWTAGRDYDGVTLGDEEALECIPLFDDPFLVVLRKDHPLAGCSPITLDQLAGERILGGSPWAEELRAVAALVDLDIRIDPSCRATGFEAFQVFASVGRGVTLMPRLALGWLRDGVVARPLEGGPIRHVKAAMPATSYHAAPARAMRELLCQLTASGDPAASA